MKYFIGIKIVTAEPAVKVSGENFKNIIVAEGEPMPLDVTLAVNGYRVTHEGGCTVWMSEEVFEKEFRSANDMSFGMAMEAMLRMGKAVKRAAWADVEFVAELDETKEHKADVYMIKTDGTVLGDWPLTYEDMKATDWMIVEDCKEVAANA